MDCRNSRLESVGPEINFDDRPIQYYHQLPTPRLLEKILSQFGHESDLDSRIKVKEVYRLKKRPINFPTENMLIENNREKVGCYIEDLEQISRKQCDNLKNQSSQFLLTKTPSPYKRWANNYVNNSKKILGEGFGTGLLIKNKQRNSTVRMKRNQYGIIECTSTEMELMWSRKTRVYSGSKIKLEND